MNVSPVGLFLVFLHHIGCLDGLVTIFLEEECQEALSHISKPNNTDPFKDSFKSGLLRSSGELCRSVSVILVSKFHKKSYSVEIVPKFNKYLSSMAGLLLHSAVTEKRFDIAKTLLYIGADVDVSNRYGITPLYKAVQNKQHGIVNAIVKCGADPNFSLSNISLLHNAASEGDLHTLEMLIKFGAKVDVEDKCGRTPLYSALLTNRTEMTNVLLAAGADVNYKSNGGKTLLHIATSENKLNIVQNLIRLGSKIDEADDEGITPLLIALLSNSSKIFSELKSNGADINFIAHNCESLLHKAVSLNRKDVVELLIKLGANISAADQDGLTPLYRAIKNDNLEIINSLIKSPEILNYKSPHSLDYPIHFAVTNGSYRSVKLLLERGSYRYLRNRKGYFPLEEAIIQNKTDIVKLLIQDDAVLLSSQSFRRELSRPLHIAVINGDVLATECLLDYGAFINTSNWEGKSPLIVAVENNSVPLIELLVKKGANLEKKTPQGDSLLHIAASKGALEAVKILVDFGLEVDARNNRGLSPLFIAAIDNNSEIIEYLVTKGANVNIKLRNGDRPLFLAISNGTWSTITTLIDLGAEVDSDRSPSAIEKAVEADRPEIIRLLTAKGVTLVRNKSLLHLAAESGSVSAIKTLLVMGIPVDVKSLDITPLWAATKCNELQSMKVLLQSGADINAKTLPPFSALGEKSVTWTLLHEAVFKNLFNATKLLLKCGIYPNSIDFRSWTPLHYAAIMNKVELARLLLQHGADVFAATNNGLTPLGIAEYSQEEGKSEMINLLKQFMVMRVNDTSNAYNLSLKDGKEEMVQ